MRKLILIDNLDSFSFNLVESFERLGCEVKSFRNTIAASAAFELAAAQEALIVISPGPGRPEQSGCCLELVGIAKGKVPLLGICLGHQAILAEAGASVVQARIPVHGKASPLQHDGTGPFAGIGDPVRVGRYHSLGIKEVPERFRVHGWIDGIAMAVSDEEALQTGLQFHPESVLTRDGDRILKNVIEAARLERREREQHPARPMAALAR